MKHTQKETLILHTWLSHKSPSAGEDGENPKSSMHKNDDDDVSSILL